MKIEIDSTCVDIINVWPKVKSNTCILIREKNSRLNKGFIVMYVYIYKVYKKSILIRTFMTIFIFEENNTLSIYGSLCCCLPNISGSLPVGMIIFP